MNWVQTCSPCLEQKLPQDQQPDHPGFSESSLVRTKTGQPGSDRGISADGITPWS